MFENLGRKLKPGVNVKVLGKPYRTFKEAREDLKLIPPNEIVGKVGKIISPVSYYALGWTPSVAVEIDDKPVHVDVTYLRVVKEKKEVEKLLQEDLPF